MLDEPSLGLAPLVVREVFNAIARLKQEGMSILLVEQNARAALAVADYAYVLETGSVRSHGPASQVAGDRRIVDTYLGSAPTSSAQAQALTPSISAAGEHSVDVGTPPVLRRA
jgi:branched-chain amino acid transport system ATP-binding protein